MGLHHDGSGIPQISLVSKSRCETLDECEIPRLERFVERRRNADILKAPETIASFSTFPSN